ncbi:hypothetical protein [Microbacterium neungamense]|uniref:hypothetical protein n=1 Tax=Microbacterium neungamense TaxID=2810535 RepID=UPI00217D4005|nr:hypothetical protein [Microbacterium neungamense]UWF78178.1 hypothetical protein JSY13_03885 [Microbacterium neungamense]
MSGRTALPVRMTDAPAPGSAAGLRKLLAATAVAGGLGYLIQFAVPLLAPDAYLTFATMWSATYLVVACLSGIQQELTRASRPRAGRLSSGFRTWAIATATASIVVSATVAVIFTVIGARLFPEDTGALIGVVVLASFGYTLVAAVSGALYGVQNWTAAGGMTVIDATLRAVCIGAALLGGGGAVALGWATAVPFVLAAAVLWAVAGRQVREHLHLDVGMARLMRNVAATLVASLATAILISGLPALLRVLAGDAGEALLAAIILVITLTRAPLIIPLLALQGYLLVMFRDSVDRVGRRIMLWSAGVMAAAGVLATAAAWLGPGVMSWLFPEFTTLSGPVLAAIVFSAGLTGVLCVTGPAVLAAHRHRWYVAGWASSAVVTIGLLLAPMDPLSRIALALLLGPLGGVVVHAVAVLRAPDPRTAGAGRSAD